ncbi:hypothetical protein BS17DRAFT_759530 [Gyrodon lividus]|nr:hypothetical protein BS17DRAFT_759530 [Gyrodon lividus]
MPIGTINPHQALPPDYNNARFQAARQPLIDDLGITHEQAAQRLANIWQAQNAIDKEEWDQDQAAELEAAQQQEDQ